MADYDFQKVLKGSILNADNKIDKKELLIDVFKTYVAKLFEVTINKSNAKDRMPFEALVQVKRNLINEFRQTSLSEYQMSVEQYEDLFEKTVKEIVDLAGERHKGEDSVKMDQTLSVNKRGFWDSHSVTNSGIIVPKN